MKSGLNHRCPRKHSHFRPQVEFLVSQNPSSGQIQALVPHIFKFESYPASVAQFLEQQGLTAQFPHLRKASEALNRVGYMQMYDSETAAVVQVLQLNPESSPVPCNYLQSPIDHSWCRRCIKRIS